MKPDPKFNGRYIEGAKGIKLFVEEVGDPSHPSILWIHGILHSRLSRKKQFESDLDKQFHLGLQTFVETMTYQPTQCDTVV
jgi:hypothetical protein